MMENRRMENTVVHELITHKHTHMYSSISLTFLFHCSLPGLTKLASSFHTHYSSTGKYIGSPAPYHNINVTVPIKCLPAPFCHSLCKKCLHFQSLKLKGVPTNIDGQVNTTCTNTESIAESFITCLMVGKAHFAFPSNKSLWYQHSDRHKFT